MRLAIPVTALVLTLLALPALAQEGAREAAPADQACVNMTPATARTADVLPEEQQEPLLASVIGDPGEQAGCTGWARCADGSTVSCRSDRDGATCWGLDNCYAVCDGVFHWCYYRPYPCPI